MSGSTGDAALEDVLVAARADAPWAFERLYTRFAPQVMGYLRGNGAADAEGLTNEVMLGVFRALPRFEGDVAGFRSWLFTIAHHRMIDDRRRVAARPRSDAPVEAYEAVVGGDVEGEAEAALGDERVRALLDELTSQQRDVVLLRVIADLSVEETSRILDKRPGAVKMLQRRGLTALRRILEEEGVTS